MKQRDIVLLPFPFSDQSGVKVRSGVIISNNDFNKTSEDVIVCAVTSNIDKSKYTVLIEQKDLENGYLYEQSAIKVENVLKTKKSLIIKVIGTVKTDVLTKTLGILQQIVEPV